MADKPDYYQVLGVAKTASADDIKRAYQRGCLSCHPDRIKNKPEKEREEANKKYVLINEAYEVLRDPKKKAVYDSRGHQGLEDLKEGKTSSSSPSINFTPNRERAPSAENAFDFFEKAKERLAGETPSTSTQTGPRKSAEERAREAAEERRKNREAQKTKPVTPVKDDFKDVADKTKDISDKLGNDALTLDEVQQIRNHLDAALKIADAAIARKKGTSGPRP